MAQPIQNNKAGDSSGMAGVYMGRLVVAENAWGDSEQNETETAIRDAIMQDPSITDKTNVSVTFGEKKELHLVGTLSDEKSRERVREIAERNTPNDVEIHDEIVVV